MKTKHPWADRSLLQGVSFTLCLNEKQFNSACKELKVKGVDYHHGRHGTTYNFDSDGNRICIVVIRGWKGRDKNSVLSLIVHEAVHVWQETREALGEQSPGREVEAYAMQNITQELFDLFDKLSNTRKGRSK